MKKATFVYKKEDGTTSERKIINPSFLKESYNTFKDFEKQEVRYITGLEISSSVDSEELKKQYEQTIKEYYSDVFMTLSEYLESKGLNPKNVIHKTFKKDGIKDLKLEE